MGKGAAPSSGVPGEQEEGAAVDARAEGHVVGVALDEGERLGGDVLGAHLGGEGAEVDAALGAVGFAHAGEELLDGGEVHALVVRAVGERGGGDEADVGKALASEDGDVRGHVGDAAVAEARLEDVGRLAKAAGVDAAAGDLDGVELAVAEVEGRVGVEGEAIARAVRDERAAFVEVGEAAQGAGIAALAEGGEEGDDGGLALAERAQLEAGAQRGERLRGGVHAAREVQRGLGESRAPRPQQGDRWSRTTSPPPGSRPRRAPRRRPRRARRPSWRSAPARRRCGDRRPARR
jgi:hypothetical protein